MTRAHLHQALASLAVVLLASSVAAQSSHAASKADEKPAAAAKAGDPTPHGKDDAKPGLGEAKPGAAEPKGVDQAARAKAERDAEREALRTNLHGPMTEPVKQELRRHAERIAKLERIRALAVEVKDDATVQRADKLLAKENARYEKWMSTLGTKTDTPSSVNAKGGAQ